jgi:hypothetical protein
MPTQDLEALAEKIRRLSLPDRLRLAADLLEQRRLGLARTIVAAASSELGAMELLAAAKGGRL